MKKLLLIICFLLVGCGTGNEEVATGPTLFKSWVATDGSLAIDLNGLGFELNAMNYNFANGMYCQIDIDLDGDTASGSYEATGYKVKATTGAAMALTSAQRQAVCFTMMGTGTFENTGEILTVCPDGEACFEME